MDPGRFERISEFQWRLPAAGGMRVPALLFADEGLLRDMDDKVGEQVVISYGGSGLTALMFGVGLVESVAMRHKQMEF